MVIGDDGDYDGNHGDNGDYNGNHYGDDDVLIKMVIIIVMKMLVKIKC